MSFGSKSTLLKKARKGFRGYPMATVAYYGPDDKKASKVVVGIVPDDTDRVTNLKRWHSQPFEPTLPGPLDQEILEFIQSHGVRTVVATDRIIGCPHEEGTDYPDGGSCPACPFWTDRDRWTGEISN